MSRCRDPNDRYHGYDLIFSSLCPQCLRGSFLSVEFGLI